MTDIRSIRQVIEPRFVLEGAGVRLLRSFAPQVSNQFDPFLLFDHFAFNEPPEGALVGFPTHPHRGIETVTYMLTGTVHHRDSLGNSGIIAAGDVQWMTAGGGIMHAEMPRLDERSDNKGFQLWVNLPAARKMSSPHYQEVKADTIPEIEKDGVKVRLVTGEFARHTGPVKGIAAEPIYLEATLAPNTVFSLPTPKGHTCLAYLFEGGGTVQAEAIKSTRMLVFSEGDYLEIHAGVDGARLMLFAGAPFREPIAPYGPFVMNTRQEIEQALEDLRNGTFVKVG